jgi:hypothetical protein
MSPALWPRSIKRQFSVSVLRVIRFSVNDKFQGQGAVVSSPTLGGGFTENRELRTEN